MGRIISSHTIVVLVLASTMIMLCRRASGGPCKATKYPVLCEQALAISGSSSSTPDNVVDILSALINITLFHTNRAVMTSNFYANTLSSRDFISPEERQVQHVKKKCRELMRMSAKSLKKSMKALSKEIIDNGDKEDAQTGLSATITYLDACKEAIRPHKATNAYLARLQRRMKHLLMLSSNPLTLLNRIKVNGGHNRRRLLSFPERKLLDQSDAGFKPDVVVANDGSGDCSTVSEAIRKASGVERYVIYVKAGTYEEQINVDKNFVTMIGEGMFSTIITSNGSVGNGLTIVTSATALITGDHFMAQDLGIFNNAGREAAQAVALAVFSDQSVFRRCSIAGYQDTLFAFSNRQFYTECRIYGTIDFIFGNAAAVFQNSTIVLRRPLYGASNVMMANGRTNVDQNTGFVCQYCKIVPGRELAPELGSYQSFLGRPWKEFSRAVVMQSYIDGAIAGEGWIMWESASYNGTLYFGEYDNTGSGSGTLSRVSWPGYHVLGTNEAMQFTVENFIGGESWLRSMGVDFISGLQ